MFYAGLALNGLAIGCVAALAAVGLLATYRVTGVFNIAFGSTAVFCAYVMWQCVRVWRMPVAVAALLVLGIVAPGVGLVLERLVYRPLRRSGASGLLVATLGVLVLQLGLVFLVWGGRSYVDAPSLLPAGSVRLPGSLMLPYATIVELCVVALIAVLLTFLLRATRVGLMVRAVVDDRDLAAALVPADRLAAGGWAFGSFLAGVAGVLWAPIYHLDPYSLTLTVLETMGVAVLARLTSLPVAVLAALAIGIGQTELTAVHPPVRWQGLVDAFHTNLFVLVLFAALMVVPRLGIRDSGPVGGGLHRVGARRTSNPDAISRLPLGALSLVLALPLFFDPADLRASLAVPALAVVFVSLVVATGYAGQISLGQAGYAGLGALFMAKLAGAGVPWLLALFLGPLLVVPLGWLTGYPAIHRRGLYLALTTFATAAVVARFVFAQPVFVGGLVVSRPPGFTDDHWFYVLELACLLLALLLVRSLHTGPMGRALVALRDSEAAAVSAGIDVRRMKVFVFACAAGLAGLGGALTTSAAQAFNPTDFDPVQGLVWFAAVAVWGVDSALGAVVGAAALVAVDVGTVVGVSGLLIGIGAVLLGRSPGGIGAAVRRAGDWLARPRERVVSRRLSPAGRAVAARVRERRAS
ncbi:branched-chain amino acid ABC transporter permease [Catenulispora rubra]|uniref:branched-chain amino acid ABC transporter permease n=1 Tax=Catenulispora rubra TaxID=280293 RepID=UPI0018924C8C|nr:ABC transporter permease [Catenulispora rubra]